MPEFDWPTANQGQQATAVLRYTPEDFEVEELFEVAFSDDGEFDWLWIEKRGENTAYIARQLARLAGVSERAVTYSGLKDRHALTRQWFCVHLPGKHGRDWAAQTAWQFSTNHNQSGDEKHGWRVLRHGRHRQKLRPGSHRGNRFVIRLREFAGDRQQLMSQLDVVRAGVPNYFGEQRFGRDGGNIDAALAYFEGSTRPDRSRPDKFEKGMYLSSARSFLFNEVLASRVKAGTWNTPLEGDVFNLRDSGSVFSAEVDAEIVQRMEEGDIHPSGPLFGKAQKLEVGGDVAALEQVIFDGNAALCAGLLRHGMKMERRALRVLPKTLSAEFVGEESLELGFSLPRGCFATTLVRELVDYATS